MRAVVQIPEFQFVVAYQFMDDFRAAAQTAAFFPVIDPQWIPAGRHPRSDPPGTGLVRFQQPFRKVDKPCEIGHLRHRSQRMDPNKEAQLAPVDVAQACKVPLIQQGEPNRPVRNGLQPPESFRRIPIRPQKVRSEVPNRFLLPAARKDAENAELEANRLMRRSFQHTPRLERRALPTFPVRIDMPKPFHLQVGMDCPALGFGRPRGNPDQQMLAARNHFLDNPAA